MLALTLTLARLEDPARTPAIFRCSAKEAKVEKLEEMLQSDGYDSYCVDPTPGKEIKELFRVAKVKVVAPAAIDTAANLKWRNATIAYANGKISPAEWLQRTKGLGETVHFLSSPKTAELRAAMGESSTRSVFAEIFLLCWQGTPCITSADTWAMRQFPDPGPFESWVLAMNDLCGPTLFFRHENPSVVTGMAKIIHASTKPGLLIFTIGSGKSMLKFFFNNALSAVPLPPINLNKITINRGLNADDKSSKLMEGGFVVEESS